MLLESLVSLLVPLFSGIEGFVLWQQDPTWFINLRRQVWHLSAHGWIQSLA